MAGDLLQLGDFTFDLDDLPEEIPLGGEQMLAVMKYPGGHKEVQSFGPQDQNLIISGVFNYLHALDKVRQVDTMYRSGKVYPLVIGTLDTRYVIIKKFTYKYRSTIEIPYELEMELVDWQSPLYPNPTSNTGVASPSTDSTAPQKTYTVVSGDTLWYIAQSFYGDGSQYRKISDANGITSPDSITAGQVLNIP